VLWNVCDDDAGSTKQGGLHPAIRQPYDAVQPGRKPIDVIAAAEEIGVLRDRRNRLINPVVLRHRAVESRSTTGKLVLTP